MQPTQILSNSPNLHDIQAVILKHHGRDHVKCLFIRFEEQESDTIKSWISKEIAGRVTHALKQIEDTKKYKDALWGNYPGNPSSAHTFNFFLTKYGYEKIFPGENQHKFWPNDPSFRKSMKHDDVRNKLQDPLKKDWESKYWQDPKTHNELNIDAMIMVADNQHPIVEALINEVITIIEKDDFGTVLFIEDGKAFRQNDQTVEHFGYVDGVNNINCLNGKELTKDAIDYVLVDEGNGRYGSYLVFRKLEQNVKVFHDEVKRVTDEANNNQQGAPSSKSAAFIGAQAIGRFRNGMPLTLSGNAYAQDSSFGRREFPSDGNAIRCPFHSHARLAHKAGNKGLKIARRGITYDEIGRNPNFKKHPRDGVGLLFMSFQKDIAGQFEALQQYLNSGGRGQNRNDPIAGQHDNTVKQKWNRKWIGPDEWEIGKRNPEPVDSSFAKVVTLKGGEYFYAPSILFLRTLDPTVNKVIGPKTRPKLSGYSRKGGYTSFYWNLKSRRYKRR